MLQTTDHHRIWSVTAGAWVLASSLAQGDLLRDPDGHIATLVKSTRRSGHGQMLDLTVEVDHTFYVDYGGNAILVHNCGDTVEYATRPEKLDHIFADEHNFEPLVEQFGSRRQSCARCSTYPPPVASLS